MHKGLPSKFQSIFYMLVQHNSLDCCVLDALETYMYILHETSLATFGFSISTTLISGDITTRTDLISIRTVTWQISSKIDKNKTIIQHISET